MFRCSTRSKEALNVVGYAPRQLRHLVVASQRRHFADDGVNQQNIAVLGGGITGLATAYYITKSLPKAKVTIYESSDRIGGWLGSERVSVPTGSILFESGARSLRPANNGQLTVRLVEELDLLDDTITKSKTSAAARNRYLYYPDQLVQMPHPSAGILNVLTSLWREPVFDGIFRAFYNDLRRSNKDHDFAKEESVAAFFSRTLDKRLVDNVLSGVIHGIYAGDVNTLSAKSLFPRQVRDDRTYQSILLGALRNAGAEREERLRDVNLVLELKNERTSPELRALQNSSVFTFREGLAQLVDKLARKLWAHGNIEIKTSTSVQGVRLSEDSKSVNILDSGDNTLNYNHVISTLSPAHLNTAFTTSEPLIPHIPAVNVMTVNLFYQKHEPLPPGPDPDDIGFGYLIPRATPFDQNPERALGIVFDNAYSPPNVRDENRSHTVAQDTLDTRGTKLTVMLGGHWWNDWPSFPDEAEGLELAKAVVKRHLNITQEPVAWRASLKRDCIPQYTIGHEGRMQTAHKNLTQHFNGRLRVAGSWIDGVGVNDCIRSAWDVVKSLSKDSHATGLEHIGNEKWVTVTLKEAAKK